MIVEYAKVLAYCDKDHSLEIEQIHKSVEDWIKARTSHDWESTTYTEFYNGTGTAKLRLDHYPVSAVTRICALTPGIKVKNTATDASNAFVTVSSTALTLTVEGGTSAGTASIAFATYTTLTTVIAQINAQSASGWAAEIYDSDFASYQSANLEPVPNLFCGAWDGVEPEYSYLNILGKPYSGYRLESDIGEVYMVAGFPSGYNNIYAKYTAYSTVPEDIKGAVLDGVKFLVGRSDESTEGIKQYTIGDLSVTFNSDDPLSRRVMDVVTLHSKVM